MKEWVDFERLDAADLNGAIQRLSKPPIARYERITSAQSIPDNAETTVVYNGTVRNDSQGAWFPDSLTPGQYNVAEAGWYSIVAGVIWDNNSTGRRILMIRAGTGTHATAPHAAEVRYTAFQTAGQVLATLVYLTAGQRISVRALQQSGGSLNLTNDPRSFLAIHRVYDDAPTV